MWEVCNKKIGHHWLKFYEKAMDLPGSMRERLLFWPIRVDEDWVLARSGVWNVFMMVCENKTGDLSFWCLNCQLFNYYILRIDSEDLNFCVLWTSFSILVICVLNVVGFCSITLLGQKLSFSEQLIALVMFELPFYGLLPGAVPFIFYIAPFAFFVMIHACLTPVNKTVTWMCKIHHIWI